MIIGTTIRSISKGLLFLFLFQGEIFGTDISVYQIGNSLTWDAGPPVTKIALEAEGYDVNLGYHIQCGASLTYIANNPTAVPCVASPEPYGTWWSALGSYDWDVVTLQAYTSNATGASEVEATKTMIRTATSDGRNSHCIFYLYLAWPQVSSTISLYDQVYGSFDGGDSEVALNSAFLDFWYNAVRAEFPELDIRCIPVGVILAELDRKLRQLPWGDYQNGYSLYRDIYHMTTESGRYVANSSILSAILKKKPADIKYTLSYLNRINSDLVYLSNEVVWSVMSKDSRSGVSPTPQISIVQDRVDGVYEVKFLGDLEKSEDLLNWTKVEDASPYRIINGETSMFYRSSAESP